MGAFPSGRCADCRWWSLPANEYGYAPCVYSDRAKLRVILVKHMGEFVPKGEYQWWFAAHRDYGCVLFEKREER